jgi:hypothetical protein
MEDLNYKLDRTAFQALSYEEAEKQITSSINFSIDDRINHFNYLMSVAYRFFGEQWPPMDRFHFEKKKRL